MAQIIKVKVKNNDICSNLEKNSNFEYEVSKHSCENLAHVLLTAQVNDWSRRPDVGEKVHCKKQIPPLGLSSVSVTNALGGLCGSIFVNDFDSLHGTSMDDECFKALPDKFVGTVVEIGCSSENPNKILMMIAVEFSVKEPSQAFTVVNAGQSLLASYGSIFTAKKESRMNGSAAVFAVYDEDRKIGIISPLERMSIPSTQTLSLQDAKNYPDEFKVKVVGDGLYDGVHCAIKVELLLPKKIPHATEEQIRAADKKILKKYLAYLLGNGECTALDLMLLSEKGKQQKLMLDKRYREIMQNSAEKLCAYFDLL